MQRDLTARDRLDILSFNQVTGADPKDLHLYLSGDMSWTEWWVYNFKQSDRAVAGCNCRREALVVYGARRFGVSIHRLESLGFRFTLLTAGENQYADATYQCRCGQLWKEEFVESGHYNAHHAYPIGSDGNLSWSK